MKRQLTLEEALELVDRFKLVDDHAYLGATRNLEKIYQGGWFIRENLVQDDNLYDCIKLYRMYYNILYGYWRKLTGGDI